MSLKILYKWKKFDGAYRRSAMNLDSFYSTPRIYVISDHEFHGYYLAVRGRIFGIILEEVKMELDKLARYQGYYLL